MLALVERGTETRASSASAQVEWIALVADSLFLGNDDTVILLPSLLAVGFGVAYIFQLLVRAVVEVLAIGLGWMPNRIVREAHTSRSALDDGPDRGRRSGQARR